MKAGDNWTPVSMSIFGFQVFFNLNELPVLDYQLIPAETGIEAFYLDDGEKP